MVTKRWIPPPPGMDYGHRALRVMRVIFRKSPPSFMWDTPYYRTVEAPIPKVALLCLDICVLAEVPF